eukprot:jgi/Chlat1/3974/Chrsp26S08871
MAASILSRLSLRHRLARSVCTAAAASGSYGQTRALLIANSTLYGGTYFGHCGETIQNFLKGGGVESVLFVPYALHDYDKYFGNPGAIKYDALGQPIDHTGRPKARLQELGFDCTSIHHAKDPLKAVQDATAIFIGGGNSFMLLNKLYTLRLVTAIRDRVRAGELLYMGSSAGSTCAGQTINASICMPIVYPPTFDALGLVPFNISPHYADPEPKAKLAEAGFTVSMEENREQRIQQYTDEEPGAHVVVGLREGTLLEVNHGTVTLHGKRNCRVFRPKQAPEEVAPGSTSLEGLLGSR